MKKRGAVRPELQIFRNAWFRNFAVRDELRHARSGNHFKSI